MSVPSGVPNCPQMDVSPRSVRQHGRGTTPGRIPVRCPRRTSGCRGQLYLESELGGHLVSLTCLHCARTALTLPAIELVQRYGVSWREIEAASWHSVPFLWTRA